MGGTAYSKKILDETMCDVFADFEVFETLPLSNKRLFVSVYLDE